MTQNLPRIPHRQWRLSLNRRTCSDQSERVLTFFLSGNLREWSPLVEGHTLVNDELDLDWTMIAHLPGRQILFQLLITTVISWAIRADLFHEHLFSVATQTPHYSHSPYTDGADEDIGLLTCSSDRPVCGWEVDVSPDMTWLRTGLLVLTIINNSVECNHTRRR